MKKCPGEPTYSTSSGAYDNYIYMDDFTIDWEFNTGVKDQKPITMKVIRKSDLVDIHETFPSENSQFGSINSGTYDVVNGGRNLPKFQEHFGYPSAEGNYGYPTKRGLWEYDGLTDDFGTYSLANGLSEEAQADFFGGYSALDQVTGQGSLDGTGGYGTYDQNG
eukprot:Awhi_evm1s7102